MSDSIAGGKSSSNGLPQQEQPIPPPDVKRFLGALFRGQEKVTVRLIETWTEKGKKHRRNVYNLTRHITSFLLQGKGNWKELLRESEAERANVFFGVCPRFVGRGRYDLAWQIRVIHVLWADLDNCTPEEAIRRCEGAGVPRPSIIVRSGHGVHLYWLLDRTYLIDDVGDPPPVLKEFTDRGPGQKKKCRPYIEMDGEKVYLDWKSNPQIPRLSQKAEHAQHVLAGIAAKIGGDHTKDLARLLRLPCTLNRKNERNGVEPVPCVLVECEPTRRYAFSEFERFAEASPLKAKAKEVAKIKLREGVKLTTARLNRLYEKINRCAVAQDRSKADWSLCCWCLERGYDKEKIYSEVMNVGKFAERGRAYFDMTWGNAADRVREKIYDRLSRPVKKQEPSRNGHGGLKLHRPDTGDGDGEPPDRGDAWEGDFPAGALPEIQGNKRQLQDVTRDAQAALIRANQPRPKVFERGGVLTRLRLNRDTNVISPEPLNNDALRGVLARVARWVSVTKTKKGEEEEDAPPPMEVVKDLANLPDWQGVPHLEAVVECPVFSRDGDLIADPGYHARSRLYYHPAGNLKIPPVSERPTPDEVAQARDLILVELMGDFPFKDDGSKAHACCALLEPFVRPMIEGPTPNHAFDAPCPGTGKSLLTSVLSIPATGRDAEIIAEGKDDEEWRKRITAILVDGPAYVMLDNIGRPLESGALAAALTARVWKDRLLGVSKTVAVPVTCTWLTTGNNLQLSFEMIRRTVWTRIDALTDQPWTRTKFRHPDITGWAKAHRGELIWAALTICRAWIAAGRPAGQKTLGMYESWAHTLGGILDVAGIPGLLGNADELFRTVNQEATEWREFTACWWEKWQGEVKKTADLFTLAKEKGMLTEVLDAKTERGQKNRLGRALNRVRDRIFGEYRIELAGEDYKGCSGYRLTHTPGA